MSQHKIHTVLGFDYGTRQIGVAIGQTLTAHARELNTLKAQNGVPNWDQVAGMMAEWQPDAVVVGLPLNMDGTRSEMCERAEKFARRLQGRFNVMYFMHDERLTTFEAKGQRLDAGDYTKNFRERPVDAIAAALVLQGWLDNYVDS